MAYWQWADSYMTRNRNPADPEPSVAFSTNTVTGYVEYWYWLNYYCNPDEAAAMSKDNWAIFSDVQMYRSTSNPNVNMEYLFSLTDPVTGGDPAATSLFNIKTLQTLVSLGQATPNIISEPNLIYGTNFTLSQEWTDLAVTL